MQMPAPQAQPTAGVAAVAPPRPALAALLSLLAPGFGHFYGGLALWPAIAYGMVFAAWVDAWQCVIPRIAGDWRIGLIVPTLVFALTTLIVAARSYAVTPRLALRYQVRHRLRDYVRYALILTTLLVAYRLVANHAWGQPTHNYSLPTASMEPTLLDGDRVRVDLTAYAHGRAPAIGDVVLVRFPDQRTTPFIKRVVAVAGESITLRGSAVQRQGRAVPLEPARAAARTTDGRRVFRERLADRLHLVSLGATDAALIDWPAGSGRVSIPPDHVFLLGDARDNSVDSRQWGPVPLSYVEGRVVGVIASFGAEGLRWDRILTDVQ